MFSNFAKKLSPLNWFRRYLARRACENQPRHHPITRQRLRLQALEDRTTPDVGITEFGGLTAGSDPAGITEGPDGNVWFTESVTGYIGRITPAGVVTEFTQNLPANSGANRIVTGPDGNLWFTEPNVNAVGRITPSGVVTQFNATNTPNLPSINGANGIAAGPDGNIWFTEPTAIEPGTNNTGEIARITPGGVVTQYHAGLTPNSGPVSMTLGPDGNLWFTENSSTVSKIGRITTSGAITEFSNGLDGHSTRIVAGPDGNLYFTQNVQNTNSADGEIGQITPSGAIQEFPIPDVLTPSGPFGITAGPDGNIWFTGTNVVGRLADPGPNYTTLGFTQNLTPGTPGKLNGITTGPDGNLWFTEPDNAKIGRVTLLSATLSAAGLAATGPSAPGDPPTINLLPGQSLFDPLASVTALDPITQISELKAQINWGDMTSSTGTITGSAQTGFIIFGSKTFYVPGSFSVQITISNTSVLPETITPATATATVLVLVSVNTPETAQVTPTLQPLTSGTNLTRGNTLTGTSVDFFSERTSFTLPQSLSVDISTPGNYLGDNTQYPDLKAEYLAGDHSSYVPESGSPIPAGTIINSYLIHFNPDPSTFAYADATISFSNEIILGIITENMITYTLDDSTNILQLPGVTYPLTDREAGLEISYLQGGGDLDSVVLSPTLQQVRFAMRAGGDLDEVRIITETINQGPTDQAPTFTSGPSTSFTVGVSNVFQVTASGYPTPSFSESGALPSGVTFNSNGLLSGTPAAGTSGTYNLVLTASNGVNPDATQDFTLTVNSAPTITTTSLPNWTVGQPYIQTIGVTGGTNPISFSVTSGTLPTGLTLNSITGAITGTPTTTSGSPFDFAITATDTNDATASQTYTVVINPAPLITTITLPNWTVNQPYNQTIAATGGTGSIAFDVSSGNLPTGLSLDSDTGAITGTPTTTSGSPFSFTVIVTDTVGATASQAYTVVINPAPVITTLTLPDWTVNQPYSQTIATSGGTDPLAFTITSGSLPTGLSLDSGSGAISGTPTTTAGSPFNFTVTVTDAAGATASQSYTIAIDSALSITTTSLPNGEINQPYSQVITTSGGTGPITFAVSTGSLPTGLSLDSATGAITGTPTTSSGSPFNFTIAATDAADATASQAYTVAINAGPVITTPTLPNWTVDQPYHQIITTSGGTDPITFSVSAGTLPTGLSLDSDTGAITGTPTTTTGSPFSFTITATDAAGLAASQVYTIAINPPLSISPTTLPPADINTAYSQTISVSGGTAPYTTFTVTGFNGGATGLTPAAVTPDASAGTFTVSGTPSAVGDATFTVNVVDVSGATLTESYILYVVSSTETVPLGLGGAFDFQPAGSATQPGFLPVYSTDTPTSGQYAAYGDGWLNPGAGSFDRSTTYGSAGVPDSPGLATLLETGEWGYEGGGSNDGQFQVTVAPNQTLQVTAYIGDTFGSGRDLINLYVGVPGNPYESLLNPSSSTFNTFASTSYKYVSYSGMFNPGSSSTLLFTIDKPDGGTSSFWTISGLDVRPVGLIAPLTLTRADSAPFSEAQVADGLTVDTYNGSGAAPFAELTINPQYGTPYGTDIDPAVKGFQVQADALGEFSFQILRPTGDGSSLITVTDVTGASGTGQVGPTAPGGLAVSPNPYLLPNPVYQTYTLPVVRRIDFGPLGTPAASDSDPNNPNYLVFDNSPYLSTAANALGWIGTAPTTFDSGGSPNNLQRDGVYGSASTPGDFELDMPAANTVYSVTVLLGDPVSAESGMFVEVVDPATGTIIESTPVSGANTPAGQSTSFTFPVTTDSSGRIRLRFGTTNDFWTLQDVEVRPEVGTASPPVGTQAALTLTVAGVSTVYSGTGSGTSYTATALPGTLTADGMTQTTYSISGATANSLITVTTSLGTLITTDAPAGSTYTGIQLQADGTGNATFTIQAPLSDSSLTGTITLTEVTGASLGVFTQNYSGVSTSPPGSPPTTVQRYEFTYNNSPVQAETPAFTSVSNTTVYAPTIGYGWQTGVNGYDRGAGSVPAPYLANLFRAGAWGEGSGTFVVSVPQNSFEDVRVYVGDPDNAWSGITVSVDGSTVAVDPVVDRYGFVTVSDVSDNGTGILDITINGGIWVASGVDVATTGNLPTPATGATNPIPSSGERLEFVAPGTAIGGFTAVSGSTVFTPGAQFGWSSPVSSFVRPASDFPSSSPLTPTEMQFYGSGAYGTGTSEFEIAVQPGASYSIRAYVSDPYNAWTGITISVEGGTTVSATATSNPPGMYTMTGQDVNGDGILTIAISAPIWVLNGIDIVQSPNTLPAAP